MSWHKPVRVGVGVFGLVAAVVVYFAIGSRQAAPPPSGSDRLDPKAITESEGADLQQVRQDQEDFQVKAERTLNYADGTVRLMGVRIQVKQRSGRDFVVTAWPVLPLAVMAVLVERLARPTVQQPSPSVGVWGAAPAFLYVGFAALYLLSLPALS